MPTTRELSRSSWRLKIERARKHFDELDAYLRAYIESRPYQVRWERHPHQKFRPWQSVFRITKQPDPEIAIVLGDVIHNVRSALDHIAVAIAPNRRKWNASFPISDIDLWPSNADGCDPTHDLKARERFEQAVRDMPEEAVATIKSLQPFARWRDEPTALRFCFFENGEKKFKLDEPSTHYLNTLSRLDNADKHRHLIAVASGIGGGYRSSEHEETGEIVIERFGTFVADGTVLATQRAVGHAPKPRVKVEIDGPLHVAVDMGSVDGRVPIEHLRSAFLEELPDIVFSALEPFVK